MKTNPLIDTQINLVRDLANKAGIPFPAIPTLTLELDAPADKKRLFDFLDTMPAPQKKAVIRSFTKSK